MNLQQWLDMHEWGTREVSRETSGPAELKDPKAIRVDIPGKRQLNEAIVQDGPDPTVQHGGS